MNKNLHHDSENIDALLEAAKAESISYLSKLNERKTSTVFKETNRDTLPEKGMGTMQALKRFKERYAPIIVASSGPRFWGYVVGGTTPASIVGDWLATVYDQNPQKNIGHGDISANIELQTIQMLLEFFDLPKEDFWGGFVTGATMSNFTCLAVARQWYGKAKGIDIAKGGLQEKINVLSARPHSSSIKALSMLGIGSANIIKVKTLEGNREAICINDLEQQLSILGNEPAIVIASGGTVNTVDYDDFNGIAALQQKYKFWWHVDAAFGGFAACSEQYKHFVSGWEKADSITVDCHKWMNVPYESAVFFVKKTHSVLQSESFQNSNAPYLGNPFEQFNYLNSLPENSRRLKALPTWFTLQAYGKEGYREIVENCIHLAKGLGQKIEAHPSFKLLAPVRLNNICFTLRHFERDEEVKDFLTALNNTGKVFMTPTRYNNIEGIRCSLVNWRTTQKDIDLVYKEMDFLIQKK